jgi:thymidylate kinase
MIQRDRISLKSTEEDFPRRSATFIENLFRCLSALDRLTGLRLKLFFAKKETLFLIDRYIIDYFLRDRIVNVKYSEVLKTVFLSLFPKPDLLFYVYASPEEILSRKVEYGNMDQIRKEIEIYSHNLEASHYDTQFIHNRDLSESSQIAAKKILSCRSRRLRRSLVKKMVGRVQSPV